MSKQTIRYSQNSKEIETLKQTSAYYDLHKRDSLVMNYADIVKVDYNTRKNIITPRNIKSFFVQNNNYMSTRAFKDLNKCIVIPVGIIYQYSNDQIIEAYGY
ncbi:hypothetical protein [Lacinutrix mariniflava]|uniref:hypothetical protein n=1 Tax=Lacinutrix mariniflava TaxID=342955 RepID=UPI00128F22F8|nr:hypothetical protein [Lacinutrix mariniflava]